jgi:hypothetical protein
MMDPPVEIRHPAILCWHCNRMLDALTPAGDEACDARPGDVSLCLYCGVVSVMRHLDDTEDLVPRCPTDKELNDLSEEQEFMQTFMSFQWHRQFLALHTQTDGL